MTTRVYEWPPPPPPPAPPVDQVAPRSSTLSEVDGLSLRFHHVAESDDEGPARLAIYSRDGERVFAEGDPVSLSDINGLITTIYLAGARDGAADGGNQDEARRRIEAGLFPAKAPKT